MNNNALFRINRSASIFVLSIFLAFYANASRAVDNDARVVILTPTATELSAWKTKSFEGDTTYTIAVDEDNEPYLSAKSASSASGLFFQQEFDIQNYPYLNWEWQVSVPLNEMDEYTKAGDDYSARVYVVVDGGLFFWNTIALNYVWSSRDAKGEVWPNAFAGDNAQMISLQGRTSEKSRWYKEKRNLVDDFKAQFGKSIEFIDAIAIMTDTDNALGRTEAAYRRVYFSKE